MTAENLVCLLTTVPSSYEIALCIEDEHGNSVTLEINDIRRVADTKEIVVWLEPYMKKQYEVK